MQCAASVVRFEPKPPCDQHKLRDKYPEEEREAQSCDPSAVVGLMRLNKGQLEEKLRATNYEASDHVFATGKGTPLDAQNMINRHFKPLLNRAELPSIRWHALRHTCFTILLARGMHPKYVQYLAGHASVQLTLDRYSH